MKDDGRTREEHIALNRVDIYRDIFNDPNYLSHLKNEMDGKDLACWCKSKSKLVGCHGDNYMHIFSSDLAERDWTKSVTVFLIGDLRICLRKLHDYAMLEASDAEFLPSYMDWEETKLQIETLISLMKKEDWNLDDAHFTLAYVAIDLELALAETKKDYKDYRLLHANWIMNTIFNKWENRIYEPSSPDPVIQKPHLNKER